MKKISLYLTIITGAVCITLAACGKKEKNEEAQSMTTNNIINEEVSPTSAAPAVTAAPKEAATPTPEADTRSVKEFIPSGENVKLLGRTFLFGDTLWLSFSASGIEFTFTGTKADITLKGDNIAITGGDTHYCRFGIYVNDELVSDELLKEMTKTITAFESESEETVTIKIIKLSEASDSTLGIDKISVVTKGRIKPTEPKAHRIEFIGDSITCGFGVDDSDVNGAYTTATEDATKTYAYKTAQALGVDYSMVSLSGYGIISGYTGDGTLNPNQIIPPYYDKMGNSSGYFNSLIQVSSIDWDFTRFTPELIVINLGTNDYSYSGNDAAKQEEYTTGYVAFLKQVREKNPDATILCTLGIMGDALYPSIEKALNTYSEETGDTNVYSMKFDVQVASDGFGACWHPSEITHTKAADKLTQEIKTLMGW